MGAIIFGLLLTRQHQHIFKVSFRLFHILDQLIGHKDGLFGQPGSLTAGFRNFGLDVQFAVRLPDVGVCDCQPSGILISVNARDQDLFFLGCLLLHVLLVER